MNKEQLIHLKEAENEMLGQIMEVSKSMLKSFEFRMIYGMEVSEELQEKTAVGLQEFRENWDTSLTKDEAYKKYMEG